MCARYSPEPLRVQVGMLLSGSGYYDGTDAQEAILCGLALDRRGARVVGLSPRRPLLHVVDHTTGEEMEAPPRISWLEAARLLHDRIHEADGYPLETLQALVVPGGFGVAKNLMTAFARPGEGRKAHPDAEAVVRHFLDHRKPVGVIGLGDILVRFLTREPLEDPATDPDPARIVVDPVRRVITTPGFKSLRRVSEVAVGIEAMAGEMLRMVEEGA